MDVWSLVAEEPVLAGDGPALTGWMHRLCRAATRALPASAAGVSVMTPAGDSAVLAASGATARVIEQLQLTCGEGPCQDAYASGRPVFMPDVATALVRWPGYAPAALDHGVQAVFAFPLQVGAARLGALDLYREETGPLSVSGLVEGYAFAEAAMSALLNAQDRNREGTEPGAEADPGATLGAPLVVYQAQGMVHIQLGITLTEALARLRGYAYAQDRSLTDVAEDVVTRRLTIEPDP